MLIILEPDLSHEIIRLGLEVRDLVLEPCVLIGQALDLLLSSIKIALK